MRISVLARCIDVKIETPYYYHEKDKKEYKQSTLKIISNERHIEGTITVREELSLDWHYNIIIDTDAPVKVVTEVKE